MKLDPQGLEAATTAVRDCHGLSYGPDATAGTAILAYLSTTNSVVVPREINEPMTYAFYGATEITREGTIRGFQDGYRAMLQTAQEE